MTKFCAIIQDPHINS